VEYATVSRELAVQVSDVLMRFGVANRLRVVERQAKGDRAINGCPVMSRRPIHVVEVSRATALVRIAGLLNLRIGYKAHMLERLVDLVGHVAPARSDLHGYDEAVALDRVKAVTSIGSRQVYGVTSPPSRLFVVNGLVTGAGDVHY
jgi:intein/homing endonuclease